MQDELRARFFLPVVVRVVAAQKSINACLPNLEGPKAALAVGRFGGAEKRVLACVLRFAGGQKSLS